MRAKFISLLITQFPVPEDPPKHRMMFRSSHRGPGAKPGQSNIEASRELALSINQEILLQAGFITWAKLKLTPCVVTTKRTTDDPAKN
ncbi:MAG: hypothetical protein PHC70_02200 [Patescibacteria group bacterium]|nr:hypothetical protein [Patescibacteria group bacterium]